MTIIFSILAQVLDSPILVVARPGMYLSWAFLGLYLLFRVGFSFKVKLFGINFMISYAVFILFCLVATLFGVNHLHAGILLPLTVSFGAYFIGVLLKQANFDEKLLKRCLGLFVVCVVCLALQIKFTYFPSLSSWMSDLVYGYAKKNSAGQLFAVSAIILLFYFNYTTKKALLVRFLLSGFLLYVLLLIQCRTALIGFIVTCFAKLIFVKKGRGKGILLYLFIGIVALMNDQVISIVRRALFLDKYAGADVNTFSSGRVGYFNDALQVFYSHPLVGNGSYYVDNFYLNLLTESGIIGLVIIVPVFFSRLFFNLKLENNSFHPKNNLNTLLKLLSVFYIIESFLEAYPPLGPGVCSFVFWLVSGYVDATNPKTSVNYLGDQLVNNPIKKRRRIRITA
ncbi:hypothetical protein CHH47_12665 [Priestia megaterium]|nr:hypothetical protein CHH47_12665 [Priestia megaterium]